MVWKNVHSRGALLRWPTAVIAVLVVAAPSAVVAVPGARAGDLAERALSVLETHCAGCHGGPRVGPNADRGGFDHVLDAEKLASDGQIARFDPGASELFRRMRDGEMPPSEVRERPSSGDLDIVRQWIAKGAPAPAKRAPARPRIFITASDVDQVIYRDLRAHQASWRQHLRYLSLVHLHNAGASREELALVRKGTVKLLNSLTWSRAVVVPRAIDNTETVYRIDLRQLGWTGEIWREIARRDPYAIARTSATARAIRSLAGTRVAQVRADWLVAAASTPPLYHHILGIPEHLRDLERRLGIEVARAVRNGRAIRAGFNGSGVSRNNRVIERHALGDGGYFWLSYDFQNSTGRRNIFDFPVDFTSDGGEVIFSLRNGFQAYMLVDGEGRRIDKAPTQIVVDAARSDSAVTNGVSCMGCHSRGIIAKKDEVRPHLIANQRVFELHRRSGPGTRKLWRALALYASADTLQATYARDQARFVAALRRIGAAGDIEPINATFQLFEAELDLARTAAELGLPAGEFERLVQRDRGLRRKLGAVLLPGGTLKRDAFVALFPLAVRTFGLGYHVATMGTADRLAFDCESGVARACFDAGLAFYRGVGSDNRRDHARARALFAAACSRRHPAGCRSLGHLYYRGHGTRRDLTRAAGLYRKACQLGSKGGCANAAFVHARGLGVTRDQYRAARFHSRACQLGQASSCLTLGHILYNGSGVARDRGRAAAVFEIACNSGLPGACGKLGHQYRWGDGVSVDWIRSYRFFERACDLGDKAACVQIVDLAKLIDLR